MTIQSSNSTDGSKRILLVEDHEDTLKVMSKLLGRLGYVVTPAATCAAALSAAQGQPFDLVISDLGLPDGTGVELMRELHTRYRLTGIALTGYGADEDVKSTQDAGFVDHLVKPVDFDKLQQAVGKAV